jgi:cob(I)alamin adenosyltransferase
MRISKVTTKTGDQGETGLGDGKRVSKSDPRMHFLGTVDELNSFIGFLRALNYTEWDPILESIQQDLFNIGGECSLPDSKSMLLKEDRTHVLEEEIARLNASLPPLKEFILPTGDEFTTRLHLARTVCRRTERLAVTLKEAGENTRNWIPYLNRLSDFLFVLARCHQGILGTRETQWKKNPQ